MILILNLSAISFFQSLLKDHDHSQWLGHTPTGKLRALPSGHFLAEHRGLRCRGAESHPSHLEFNRICMTANHFSACKISWYVEANRTTASAKSEKAILKSSNQTPWLRLEILSMKITNRIKAPVEYQHPLIMTLTYCQNANIALLGAPKVAVHKTHVDKLCKLL